MTSVIAVQLCTIVVGALLLYAAALLVVRGRMLRDGESHAAALVLTVLALPAVLLSSTGPLLGLPSSLSYVAGAMRLASWGALLLTVVVLATRRRRQPLLSGLAITLVGLATVPPLLALSAGGDPLSPRLVLLVVVTDVVLAALCAGLADAAAGSPRLRLIAADRPAVGAASVAALWHLSRAGAEATGWAALWATSTALLLTAVAAVVWLAHALLRDVAVQHAREVERMLRRAAAAEAEAERYEEDLHGVRSAVSAITRGVLLLRDPRRSTPVGDAQLDELVVGELVRLDRRLNDDSEPEDRLETGPVDVSRTIAGLVAVERRLGARIDCDLVPVTLPVAPQRFAEIVHVLLVNARVHAAGARVHVSARISGKVLQITVGDAGAGLPEGADPFERGVRGDTTGAGLGLFVARRHLAALGGSLTALTRPGGGACFTVTLPLGTQPPPTLPAQRRRSGAPMEDSP